MTSLNVFAAVFITGEFCTGSVCADCTMYLANGEVENPDETWNFEQVRTNLDMFDVTLGHHHETNEWDTRCSHLGSECDDDCDCEATPFVHGDNHMCWLCHSTLGGSRDDITAIRRDLLTTKMTQEQFDKINYLCAGYKVPMTLRHYRVQETGVFGTPAGWVEGWIGGNQYANSTIYVGVSPEGDSHS